MTDFDKQIEDEYLRANKYGCIRLLVSNVADIKCIEY